MITWTTPGNLGSRPEGTVLTITLVAVNSLGSSISYSVIAGELPSGLTLSSAGQLSGLVIGNRYYRFVVRAKSNNDVADRTFSMLVVGNVPIVVTAGTSTITLPDQLDITDYSYQIVVIDPDIQDTITYRIVSGVLPDSLTLSSTGLISGIIAQQPEKRFDFTVRAYDGSYSVNKRFVLNITNRLAGVAVKPLILNRNSDIGTFRTDDQFSYKIKGTIDGIRENTSSITYSIGTGSLPPGLTLRTNTGWIDGFLSSADFSISNKITYTFTVIPSYNSINGDPKTFRITIDPIPLTIESLTWNIDSDLGTIKLGGFSNFTVNPFPLDSTLVFRIRSGSGTLPPNLFLQSNGTITGRVSFLGTNSTPTSPIGIYTFTVDMINYMNVIVASKNFTIRTLYQVPYERIQLLALPRPEQRERILDLLTNTEIVPSADIYRPTDVNYGIRLVFKMTVLTGLAPGTAERYVAAMVKNHQRKVSYIQEFRYAVAINEMTNLPIYEVVYAVVGDKQQSSPATITLQKSSRPKLKVNNTQINASYGGIIDSGQEKMLEVYPNSFNNMRKVIGNTIGFVNISITNSWRSTIQDDGSIVGYTDVLPLVYVLPGRGGEIVDNIIASGERFDLVPFDVDGYIWEDYVEPMIVGANEIATSGITTKYLAFPRTGVIKDARQQL